jgi:lambda family phage portal protein
MIAPARNLVRRIKAAMRPKRRAYLEAGAPRPASAPLVDRAMKNKGGYTHAGWADAKELVKLGYRAADFARSGGQQTVAQGGSADRHIRYDRETLIAESQRFDRDNCLYHGVINRLIDSVVGAGFGLQARTGNPRIDKILEAEWKAWIASPEIRSLFDWTAVERMMLRAMLVDGDVGAIKTTAGKLQIVESEAITYSVKHTDGAPRIEQGIELDEYGRPLRFHVASYTSGGFVNKAATKPVDAANFLFLLNPMRASQTRGIPLFVPAFPTLHRLNDVLDAEAVSWQLQSRHALAVSSESGGTLGYNSSLDDSNKSNAEQIPERLQELDYALIFYGKKGEKVEGITRTAPGSNFEQSVTVYLRIIGMTVGMPLEMLLLDWSKTNYSSARASIEQFSRVVQGLQSLLMRGLHGPVYQWKVQEWIQSGKVILPKSVSQEQALAQEWIAPEIPWVDPLKEVQSWGKKMAFGLSTHSSGLKSLNKDRENWIDQRKREVIEAIAIADEINAANPEAKVPWQMFCGVEVTGATQSQATAKPEEEPKDDEGEQEDDQEGEEDENEN